MDRSCVATPPPMPSTPDLSLTPDLYGVRRLAVMDIFSADSLAFYAIAGLALAAVVAAVVRGHLRSEVGLSAEHVPQGIILTAKERLEVQGILNERDALADSLEHEPLKFPFWLEPDVPMTLAYRESTDAPRPKKLVLRLEGGNVRSLDLPPL